jgi:integrase
LAKDLTRADVQRMVDQITQGRTKGIHKGKKFGKAVVKGGGGTAARVASLLGGIYSWGEKRGLVAGLNPVRGVETARYEPRDRVCSTAELRALGEVLAEQEATQPAATAALKLLALSGLRREEACGLKWSEIDESGHCLRLAATKTGKSVRPLGTPALALLKSLPAGRRPGCSPMSLIRVAPSSRSRSPGCSIGRDCRMPAPTTCAGRSPALLLMRGIRTRRSPPC